METLPSYFCKLCLHKWTPRKPQRPWICPRCKSPKWDQRAEVAPGAGGAATEEPSPATEEERRLSAVFRDFLLHAPEREVEVLKVWLSLWHRRASSP